MSSFMTRRLGISGGVVPPDAWRKGSREPGASQTPKFGVSVLCFASGWKSPGGNYSGLGVYLPIPEIDRRHPQLDKGFGVARGWP